MMTRREIDLEYGCKDRTVSSNSLFRLSISVSGNYDGKDAMLPSVPVQDPSKSDRAPRIPISISSKVFKDMEIIRGEVLSQVT